MILNFLALKVHSNPCVVVFEAGNQTLHINILKLDVEFQIIRFYY